jgi:hypothetical protein
MNEERTERSRSRETIKHSDGSWLESLARQNYRRALYVLWPGFGRAA